MTIYLVRFRGRGGVDWLSEAGLDYFCGLGVVARVMAVKRL